MKYKLKDLQGAGLKEDYIWKSREEVRENLFEFHSIDCELTGNETLEDLLEIGGWELVEIKE